MTLNKQDMEIKQKEGQHDMLSQWHPKGSMRTGGSALSSVFVRVCESLSVAARGDSRPGVCVGKADASEAAGSPALSFPWKEGTRGLLLHLAAAAGQILI